MASTSHRLRPKIEALWLYTLRRLLSLELAHWKTLTPHFLCTSNMPFGRLTLATNYSPRNINTNIPVYHQELLRAWAKHQDQPTYFLRRHPKRTPIPIWNNTAQREAYLLQDLHRGWHNISPRSLLHSHTWAPTCTSHSRTTGTRWRQ